MLKINRGLCVLAVAGYFFTSFNAASAELRDLINDLHSAERKKENGQVLAICEQILARDVVADFLADGADSTRQVMRSLREIKELGGKLSQWKQELAENPTSPRANYLLALSQTYISAYNADGKGGRSDQYAPLRLRLRRSGSTFTGEFQDKQGRWTQIDPVEIAMPRKILAGICATYGGAKLGQVKVTENEKQISPQWVASQVGRPTTAGTFKQEGDRISVVGTGLPPRTGLAEDVFFLTTELNGDGNIEVLLEEVGGNAVGGLMLRASLDPGAPFAALVLQRPANDLYLYSRVEANDASRYFQNLCAVRPGDPQWVLPLLEIMASENLIYEGYLAAQRLLAEAPQSYLSEPELFHLFYLRNNQFPKLYAVIDQLPVPADEEERLVFAQALEELLGVLQKRNDPNDREALQEKIASLRSGSSLSTEEVHQKAALGQNKKPDSVDLVRKLFLGDKGSSEQILSSISVGESALTPDLVSSIHLAVQFKVDEEIAGSLDRVSGTSKQKAAAKAVAMALRIAARERRIIDEARKAGATFASRLPKEFSDEAKVLLVYELQQFDEGRVPARSILSSLLKGSATEFSRADLLLWDLRLAEFQGREEYLRTIRERLKDWTDPQTLSNRRMAAQAIQFLLQIGELDQAKKIRALLEKTDNSRTPGPFSAIEDAIELVNLHAGEGTPMPIIWTSPKDDEVVVQWEFAPANWAANPIRETRPMGLSVARLDQKYDLELYAFGGQYLDGELPEDQLVTRLEKVDSKGSWTGKIPTGFSWLVGVMKNSAGETLSSPAVPIVTGKNLLSKLDINAALAGGGKWKGQIGFWGSSRSGEFPRERAFVSRWSRDEKTTAMEHQPVEIDPGLPYVFSAWLKADNGQEDGGMYYSPDAVIGLRFFDAQGKEVARFFEAVTIANRWTLVSKCFREKGAGNMPLPPNAVSAKVSIDVAKQCEIGDIGLYETR